MICNILNNYDEIRTEAQYLADQYFDVEDTISIYWFPDNEIVQLILIILSTPKNEHNNLHPFYFKASPEDNLPFPSASAIILPEEFGKLNLPKEWGEWENAILLKPIKQK